MTRDASQDGGNVEAHDSETPRGIEKVPLGDLGAAASPTRPERRTRNSDNPLARRGTGHAKGLKLSDLISRREAKSINRKLDAIGEEPVQDDTEAKLALTTWKVHDALAGLGILTVFIALVSAGVALSTTHVLAGWVAFFVVLFLGAVGAASYNDKRNWEAVNAVLHHRLNSVRD